MDNSYTPGVPINPMPPTPPTVQSPYAKPPKPPKKNPLNIVLAVAGTAVAFLLILIVAVVINAKPKTTTTQEDPIEQVSFDYKFITRDEVKGPVTTTYTLTSTLPKEWHAVISTDNPDNARCYQEPSFLPAVVDVCTPWRFGNVLNGNKQPRVAINTLGFLALENWLAASWQTSDQTRHLFTADPAKRLELLNNLLSLTRVSELNPSIISDKIFNPFKNSTPFKNTQEVRYIESKGGILKGYTFLTLEGENTYNPTAYFVLGVKLGQSPYVVAGKFFIFDKRWATLQELKAIGDNDPAKKDDYIEALEDAVNVQKYDDDTLQYYKQMTDFVEDLELKQKAAN
jgi:hypothetical protein